MKLISTILIAVACFGRIAMAQPPQPIKALMIVGGHSHDYKSLPVILADRLSRRGQMVVGVNDNVLGLTVKSLEPYQVLIFNDCQRPQLSEEFKQAVIRHVQSGKGLVVVHCSLWSYIDWPEWDRMIGGRVETHDKYCTYDVVVLDPANAIASGLGNRFTITDEPYLVDKRDLSATVLIETAEARHDTKGRLRPGPDPQAWVKRYGQGRIFVTTFGHDAKSQDSEQFLTLMHNGIRWVGGLIDDTVHNKLTRSEEKAGFELLFNGRDLDGWQGDLKSWKAENGELVGRFNKPLNETGKPIGSFVSHSGNYADFLLKFSFKQLKGGSGVEVRNYLFAKLQADGWGLLTTSGKQAVFPASVPSPEQLNPYIVADGWNDVTIQARGPKIVVMVNGITTSKLESATPNAAPITFLLLPGEDTEARFRDVRIRRIRPDEQTTSRPD